jgi:peptidoglycan glycosyltransferase
MQLTRRGRLAIRGLPIVALATIAFILGVAKGAGHAPARDAGRRFLSAWQHRDFGRMYAQLGPTSQARFSEEEMKSAYDTAAQTATLQGVAPSAVRGPFQAPGGGRVLEASLLARTKAFGTIDAPLVIPLEGDRIAWSPNLVFPGLRPGEHLERRSTTPPRAAILTADGVALAQGPPSARTSPLGDAATAVAGRVGQPDPIDAIEFARAGFPTGALAGTGGLEKAFNLRLAGQPGGELFATTRIGATGGRLLARGAAKPAKPLVTTIDSRLQRAAVTALAGQPGGIALLDAANGEVRALAGSAFSVPAPPGSTFKMVTTVAALEAHAVKLSDTFPFEKSVNVGGREIGNAHDEVCGGSFVQAFAQSCNSVFAPLGPKIGNDRLVATAERFGFNAQPTLYDSDATAAVVPPQSTIPDPIGSDLDLGVTAIGQGRLLATPLEMASVAQTIAAGGVRSPTPIVAAASLRAATKPVRVMSTAIAATLKQLMLAVVNNGTGHAAALAHVAVAGKTGTAELGPKPQEGELDANGEQKKQEVDAWFAGFAPAAKPKLVICVLLTGVHGDGGEVAAPLAREVLASYFER